MCVRAVPVSSSLLSHSVASVCDPTDCSLPGFPVLHHIPEFGQTHVLSFGDAIQPSPPLFPWEAGKGAVGKGG